MDQNLTSAINDAQLALLETYSLAFTYGANKENDYAQTLFNLFEETQKIKENGKRCELALEKAKMQMTIEDFSKVYDDELQSSAAKQTQIKKTSEYKEFKLKMDLIKTAFEQQNSQAGPSNSQSARVECDEFVMETAINLFDPLTKRRMENPVKNRICGHHYEESSILEAIAINPRLRCPVAGCGNKNFVEKKNLLRDEQFKLQLANARSQEDDDELI